MIFWVVLSGFFDAMHIGFGAISALVVLATFNSIRTVHFFEDQRDAITAVRFHKFIAYVPWLIVEIVKSAIQVASMILHPKMDIEPSIISFKVDLPSAHAKMVLGNSITLTPGTLTVDIKGDQFVVHALSPKTYAGIVDDSIPKKVLGVFSPEDHPVVRDVSITHSNQQLPKF
jgi:multicomponent Na+:H+ antiporter subunit E